MSSKVEFFVQMSCESCVDSLKKCLSNQNDIQNFDIQLQNGTVIIESTLPIHQLQSLLKSTGRKAVLKGTASSLSAVSIIEGLDKKIQGVIRFMEIEENNNLCIVDGTIDGLEVKQHSLCVYECGDLSNGCESVGSLYKPMSSDGTKSKSILGTFQPDINGRAVFRFTTNLNLSDVIGRAAVLTYNERIKLACGIIARSAGLFQNPKTICACDGVSIWDETNKIPS